MTDERHRNCWTCGHDYQDSMDVKGHHDCEAICEDQDAEAWADVNTSHSGNGMPYRESTPCPGWEAKEGS
ncbi:hypothetical protein HQ535_08945 [bacterium]|nr:hypothetical protein [bacterium]